MCVCGGGGVPAIEPMPHVPGKAIILVKNQIHRLNIILSEQEELVPPSNGKSCLVLLKPEIFT